MTEPDRRRFQLEAGTGSDKLLDAYDAASDTWAVPFGGDFWAAVDRAHALGHRGQGRRIAIIDTACDVTVPALAKRGASLVRVAPKPLGPEDTSHGTAVTLLVARVAPDAQLDVYAVAGDDGRIDAADVVFAIRAAAESQADILNLSLGAATVIDDLDGKLEGLQPEQAARYLREDDALAAKAYLADLFAPHGACRVCDAALAAAKAGKMVFAAAGNDGAQALCPSRSAGAVSGGFQSEAQNIVHLGGDAGDTETATAAGPRAPQSLFNDIALKETDGVLGTSFASPLLAGAAALGLESGEIAAYVATVRPAYQAAVAMTQLALGQGDQEDLVAFAKSNFQRAMKLLPHVHSGFEAYLRGGQVAVSPPESCASCGLFARALYINHGLFLLNSGALDAAISLMEATIALVPHSAEAAANHGRTLQARGDLPRALAEYDRALSLRPGFPVYANQRAVIVNLLAGKTGKG